jgi:hypothetical protein
VVIGESFVFDKVWEASASPFAFANVMGEFFLQLGTKDITKKFILWFHLISQIFYVSGYS